MTDPLPETWHARDLPVLTAIVKLCEHRPRAWVGPEQLRAELNLDERELQRAILALESDGYFRTSWAGGELIPSVSQISPHARRAVGTWPTTDQAADRLLAALTAVADHDPDEGTRTKARAALDHLGALTRDTIAAVAATVITGQIPGAAS